MIDEVVVEHYDALTQEHQLSSRIGQALEDKLNGERFLGAGLSIITQDMPDKGIGALEKKIGTDMFIGVSVEGQFDKGFLVQSKWLHNVDPKLPQQCQRMLDITAASFVWFYGARGVRIQRAEKVIEGLMHTRHQERTWSENPAKLMGDVLACRRGDHSLGIPAGPNRRARLTSMLKQMAAGTAVSIAVKPWGEDIRDM
ncbi:hypothetical protein MesoLj113a_19330 [Mesorhizobium sp. 113-1-2]|uniref:hypothetical protein n=1 Tax=Mesorhizobium sp. 113-1-2 TaxID=2744515 RepID=UPI0008197C5B|nr:hypothetical protein [Mesorhizobium sp. 113-1-2]BAV48096.1 Uncharacterized protein MLTONO_3193 [Mesorhizobium loti]BCG70775.1 hypothetical protein MesoLj113a_19330 [Mesorhizobium sp. 113-1-2]